MDYETDCQQKRLFKIALCTFWLRMHTVVLCRCVINHTLSRSGKLAGVTVLISSYAYPFWSSETVSDITAKLFSHIHASCHRPKLVDPQSAARPKHQQPPRPRKSVRFLSLGA
jgi:hypothetical protein